MAESNPEDSIYDGVRLKMEDSKEHRGMSGEKMMRDMDRYDYGRMYYTETDKHEKEEKRKSDIAKQKFMESKGLQDMETYVSELMSEMSETMKEATPEMKNQMRTKVQNLIARM